jgi:hypothetical protein
MSAAPLKPGALLALERMRENFVERCQLAGIDAKTIARALVPYDQARAGFAALIEKANAVLVAPACSPAEVAAMAELVVAVGDVERRPDPVPYPSQHLEEGSRA